MLRRRRMLWFELVLFTLFVAASGAAQENEKRSEDEKKDETAEEILVENESEKSLDPASLGFRLHSRVNVIGDARAVADIPGSAHFIDRNEMELQRQGFDDVNRILRQVPGVVIQEEEGYGLRPNVGMRGSGTERSSKITLMEDGVLIAPAPYAAPAAYYFPVAGRMESIEVRKGSSQIKFGPITTSGVLNLISTPVPSDLRLFGDVSVGGDRTRKARVGVGDAYGNFGWNFETYQIRTDGFKRIDGGGETGFDIEDYVGKLRFHTSPESRVFQEVELKVGYAEELADETYLGITDEDFARTPLRRYAASQLDQMQWEHEQYQLRHFLVLPRGVDLTTVVYRNDFHRNWYKLQSIQGAGLGAIFDHPAAHSGALEVARGADSDADALAVRANNRTYYSQGVQSTLGLRFGAGRGEHELEVGFRYHQDEEDRFQHDDAYRMLGGRMILTSPGAPGSQANRVSEAEALAFFVQDEIRWNRVRVTPGLRFETIDFTRTDYGRADPDRVAPTGVRENAVDVLIPGVGLTFDWTPAIRLFGGVHRGFAPPGPGANEETEAESSVNYELGIRKTSGGLLEAEAVFFWNDYRNLLGADTLASGGTGTGELFNGGEARAAGLELSLATDLGARLGRSLRIPLRMAYTFVDAVFQTSFESEFGPWGEVQDGDRIPYIPAHQLYASAAIERDGWLAGLNAQSTSRMRTRAGQGPLSDREATDAFLVVNLFGEYALTDAARLFVNVQNVADASYIVARAPAGARPGLPRTLMAGVKFRLGS